MVSGHWQMVGGPVGQSVQPAMPNHVLIVTDYACGRETNGDMGKETRRQTEIQAGDRLVMAETIKTAWNQSHPFL